MAPQHLSSWRSLARKGKLAMPVPVADDPFFAAVEVAPEATIPEPEGDWIEVCVGELIVRLSAHTEAMRIAEIVAALRAS
jgi:transposase